MAWTQDGQILANVLAADGSYTISTSFVTSGGLAAYFDGPYGDTVFLISKDNFVVHTSWDGDVQPSYAFSINGEVWNGYAVTLNNATGIDTRWFLNDEAFNSRFAQSYAEYMVTNALSVDPPIYVGVNGKAREVKAIYVGVNGKAREVKAIYVGVNGKARKVF